MSNLSNGTIQVGGSAVTTFTGTQLAAGQVTFRHDGSETTAASFNVSVEDGNEDNSAPVAQTFSLIVNPVNDAPVIATTTGLTLNEGAAGTITAAQLDFNDVDNTDAQLTYTVTTASNNGTLYRNGVALALNGTFTQDDINNGLITYTHNGSETTTASFGFSVSDGAGGTITGQSFAFTVAPVNDPPTLTATANDRTMTEGVATGTGLFDNVSISAIEVGQVMIGSR